MTERNVRLGEGDKVTVRRVPRLLVKAYSEFVEVLPKRDEEFLIPFSGGAVTQRELVDHLRVSDDIGKSAARAFLESHRSELQEEGIDVKTEKELIQRTSESLLSAAAKIREGQS